tara:strand:- start:238 stop:378 length:141 start_codon:yes stop_codon:yes gene_type:complete
MGGLVLLGIWGYLVFVTISFKISDLTRNKKQVHHIFCNGLKFGKNE